MAAKGMHRGEAGGREKGEGRLLRDGSHLRKAINSEASVPDGGEKEQEDGEKDAEPYPRANGRFLIIVCHIAPPSARITGTLLLRYSPMRYLIDGDLGKLDTQT